MSDQVRYVADITRRGRFGWVWSVTEQHTFTSGHHHTTLDSGITFTEGAARRAAKRAVKRRKRELKWDVFSTSEEITT